MGKMNYSERMSRLAASTVLFSFIFIILKYVYYMSMKVGTRIYIDSSIIIGFEHLIGPFMAISLIIVFIYLAKYCFAEYFNFAKYENKNISNEHNLNAEYQYLKFVGVTKLVLVYCMFFSICAMFFLNAKVMLIFMVSIGVVCCIFTKDRITKIKSIRSKCKEYNALYKVSIVQTLFFWIIGAFFMFFIVLIMYTSMHTKKFSIDFLNEYKNTISFEFINFTPDKIRIDIENNGIKTTKTISKDELLHSSVELQALNQDKNLLLNLKREEKVYYYDVFSEVYKGEINVEKLLKEGRNSIKIYFYESDSTLTKEYKVINTIDLKQGKVKIADKLVEKNLSN